MPLHPARELFTRQTSGVRATSPCTLAHALATCPPGWHPAVRQLFLVVTGAGGRVWDCEPKWGELDVGLELPPDVADDTISSINAVVVATSTTCEACGAPGRTDHDAEYVRTLCEPCARAVREIGWTRLRSRYPSP